MTYTPPLWPVSVKGVALDAQDRVVLLKNERDEWELPGGRLEIGSPDGAVLPDASPEAALEREIRSRWRRCGRRRSAWSRGAGWPSGSRAGSPSPRARPGKTARHKQ
ncbi:hypothetical protein ACTWQK_45600, partial [Streptomyces sp. 6N106]